MNPVFYFVAFVLFLLSQYAMIMVSLFVADWTGATGNYYWSIVIVVFLLLNELCFHSYDLELNFDDEDDDGYDWIEEDK